MFRGSQKPARKDWVPMTAGEFLGQREIYCFSRHYHPDMGWITAWIDTEGRKRIEVGE